MYTQRRTKFKRKRQWKIVLAVWSVVISYYCVNFSSARPEGDSRILGANSVPAIYPNSTKSLVTTYFNASLSSSNRLEAIIVTADADEQNCTPPAIEEFPRDLFTQEQRRHGYLTVHFLASVYIYYCLAVICDDYFVPCIKCICDDLHLSSDVAGATFLAAAASSPELFTNIIGTFITKGDFGVGTIVGSAVFNILGICAFCGIFAKTALPLEWYPMTRDCLFYSVSVGLLIVFISKQQIFWYEALILLLVYVLYLIVLWKNVTMKRNAERFVAWIQTKFGIRSGNLMRDVSDTPESGEDQEKAPLLGPSKLTKLKPRIKNMLGEISVGTDNRTTTDVADSPPTEEEEEPGWSLTQFPPGFFMSILWLITWPARFVLIFTIPDCQKESLRKFYPVTMIMCIFWIAILSYIVNWMMTIIGFTLSIPDSVMGLTFIAAGTSLPEIVTSIIVVRQGLGSMGISGSIGSNTFDILVCLGLPWLIKASLVISEPENYVKINSAGLGYSVSTLLFSLIVLYTILFCNGFYLTKKVGYISLFLYICFLVFASLFEMNVFFVVNLPTCNSDY